MRVALHFSLQLANHTSKRFDFGVVLLFKQRYLAITVSLAEFFYEKEGTTILDRVAFLLRLSVFIICH